MSTAVSVAQPLIDEPDENVAEHGPPPILAQHLRLARQHLQQAADSLHEIAALTADGEWREHAAQLAGVVNFVEERYAAMALGQRSFLTTEQFQIFSTLLRERR